MKSIEASPEQLLAESKIDGLVIAISESERPLRGLASRIDWRLRGAISHFLKSGAVSGEAGECTLLPIRREGLSAIDEPYRLVLIGSHEADEDGKRNPLPQNSIEALKRNLQKSGMKKVAVSRSDLGNAAEQISKQLSGAKGVELWITP